jgi:hypothetical protein
VLRYYKKSYKTRDEKASNYLVNNTRKVLERSRYQTITDMSSRQRKRDRSTPGREKA